MVAADAEVDPAVARMRAVPNRGRGDCALFAIDQSLRGVDESSVEHARVLRQQAAAELRRASSELRPSFLQNVGCIATIESVIDR